MKKLTHSICSFLIASLFLFFALQGHALQFESVVENQHNQKISSSLESLVDSGKLRIAMYKEDTEPFYFQNLNSDGTKGPLQGIDVEIIEGFARKLGLEPVYLRSDSLDGAIDMVVEGYADVAICKLSITFSRASRVLFTKPYIKLRKGLLVNRVMLETLQQKLGGLSKDEAIQQLSGKLGVLEDSSYVNFANQRFKHQDLELMPLPSWDAIVKKVTEGEYIAAFRDEAEVKKVIADDKSNAIPMLTVDLVGDYDLKGIALPLNAHHLKALLDLHINALGLELTASSLLFDYSSVIKQLNRYESSE